MVNLTYSQEVKSVYRFKKEVKKRIFTKYELDSLVLYEDGRFTEKSIIFIMKYFYKKQKEIGKLKTEY